MNASTRGTGGARMAGGRQQTCCAALRVALVGMVFTVLAACASPAAGPPGAPAEPAAPAAAAPAPAGGPAPTAAPAPEAIRVILATLSASTTPVVVAQEGGFMARHGLDAELVVARSGAESMAALLSGDALVGVIGGQAVINAVAGGADLVYLAIHQQRFTFQLLSNPDIRVPADMRGKRLGVADVGGSSDLAAQYFLNKFGLRRNEDVAVAALGGQNERLGGLQAGAVHAVMLAAPFTAAARQQGYHVLFDYIEEDYLVPTSGIVAKRSTVQERPDVFRRFVHALVDAVHYYKTDRDGTAAIVGRFLKLDDRAVIDEIYRETSGEALPEAPYPSVQAMVNAQAEVAPRNEAAGRLRMEDIVDDRFVRALDESGYIRQLYGR